MYRHRRRVIEPLLRNERYYHLGRVHLQRAPDKRAGVGDDGPVVRAHHPDRDAVPPGGLDAVQAPGQGRGELGQLPSLRGRVPYTPGDV